MQKSKYGLCRKSKNDSTAFLSVCVCLMLVGQFKSYLNRLKLT